MRTLALILLLPSLTTAGDDFAKVDARMREEGREHWAFEPVKRPPIPDVKDASWCRTPIDRFILAKLEAKGWTPSPSPSPLALLRRLHFDVTGLPPTLDDQDRFLRDPSPEALDREADRLLASPQYGERWARHWLDVARFAESNGYERDAEKPSAWRYRDWVIRAFNEDKPFDRFVLEQLAGDELPDADASSRIATGFLRLGPWDDEPSDPKQDRFDQLDDLVAATSDAFLGLTLACARCHDHKFEPFSAVDYTRMVALFMPLERPRDGRTELEVPVGSPDEHRQLLAIEAEIATHRRELTGLRESAEQAVLSDENSPLSAEVRKAIRTPEPERDDFQRGHVRKSRDEFDRLVLAAMSETDRLKTSEHREAIERLNRARPAMTPAYVLREQPGETRPTHLLNRGQATSPGPIVPPGLPVVLVPEQPEFASSGAGTSRRRLTLARWIASDENPQTARVIVNRVWQFHFGEGLVRSPNDLGTAGLPPTHPELLDWLADWFTHEGGWSIKRLNRLILTSSVSRMGKAARAECLAEDPDDELLWRLPYRRLQVEAIRDAILSASGRLNPKMYGPSMFPSVPRGALEGNSDPDKILKASDEREASRRTIYAFVKRSMIVPMIEVLDFCDTTRSAPKRPVTNTAPQALALFNGEFVTEQAGHLADRLLREAPDTRSRIDLAYRLTVCRPANDAEKAAWFEYLVREGEDRRGLARMCRITFNLNEFAFTD